MSDREAYYYPSYPGDNSSLILLSSEVCRLRVQLSPEWALTPPQPDSFQVGGGHDAQQVDPLVVIDMCPVTYR